MASYELRFPEYLDGYELETEAKGYLVGVQVVLHDTTIELTIYDQARLLQEVADETASDGYFAVANLLVVSEVTREAISEAVERLSSSGFHGLSRST